MQTVFRAFDSRSRSKEPVSLPFYPFGHAHFVKMTYLVWGSRPLLDSQLRWETRLQYLLYQHHADFRWIHQIYKTIIQQTSYWKNIQIKCKDIWGTNHLHWKTGNSGWKIKWVAPFRLLRSFRKYELSLRSRRLEVVGERENGRLRGRHARGSTSPLACLLLARPFFLVPTTSKRLLRRLIWADLRRSNFSTLFSLFNWFKYICCS